MREKFAMVEAWARARLQMQYEDDFFYNYDEWDSFVDLSTLRSSSGECCSISYLLEKWSWLKEQFARIRTSRLLESSTGRWKKAKVTHGVSKPALGLVRRGEAASSSEVGAVEQEVRVDVIPVRQDCWVVRGLVKVRNRVGAIRGLRTYTAKTLDPQHPITHQHLITNDICRNFRNSSGCKVWAKVYIHETKAGTSSSELNCRRSCLDKVVTINKESIGIAPLNTKKVQDGIAKEMLKIWKSHSYPGSGSVILGRSKHGRELLMDKIDTKLMRKLKNRKYIVNMWKTLVEAKLVFGSLIRDLGPESAGSSRNMVTFFPLLQL
ncbi:hypothetical protein SELMODRAFT_415422 [Selaginella moellendorffii]|uniref:Uncharacterized protein n=1 Tax=Selaginella moellendorffii TaxID=88036 RepID=D8RW30_SELML|nr:hypothetical protein SELMODRAFT_415422 [Selaginella moellendorffii]